MKTNKTYLPKVNELERKCYIVDATGQILGRLAARVATVLRGKHKPTYTPHLDCGDTVIVINAEKIRVTGRKLEQKEYHRYSGYPSGQRTVPLGMMLVKAPHKVIELAVNRMIPKGALGNQFRTRLRVYAGDQHPHAAQKPVKLDI
ncbi:MAG: 50S ribosomal protein L13 [Candidatus Omnitrophica bacterium]|nr:50S ribosomal protein L13 [Candidatus Omnitrophota bacterium]